MYKYSDSCVVCTHACVSGAVCVCGIRGRRADLTDSRTQTGLTAGPERPGPWDRAAADQYRTYLPAGQAAWTEQRRQAAGRPARTQRRWQAGRPQIHPADKTDVLRRRDTTETPDALQGLCMKNVMERETQRRDMCTSYPQSRKWLQAPANDDLGI